MRYETEIRLKIATWVLLILSILCVLTNIICWSTISYIQSSFNRVYSFFEVLGGAAGPSPTLMFILYCLASLCVIAYLVLVISNESLHLIKMILLIVGMVSVALSLVAYLSWFYESGIDAYMANSSYLIYDISDGVLIGTLFGSFITEILLLKNSM